MRIELTHDIIALKIWEQLPERDKQLRMVKNSLHQRLRDYNRGSGSLLGEKELIAWEELLTLLNLSEEQKSFIEKSKVAIEQKKSQEKANEQRKLQLTEQKLAVEKRARKRQVYFSIGMGLLAAVAIGLSLFAMQSQKQAINKEKEAILSANNMALALQDFVEIKDKETDAAVKKAEQAYDFKSIVFTAKAFKGILDTSEHRIKNVIADEQIITNFKKTIDSLKSKVGRYIDTYGAIVESKKAGQYKKLMVDTDKAIRNRKYEEALILNKQVSDLDIDFVADAVKKKEVAIKQQAFDYYFEKARSGFDNQRVLSGKFIIPFQMIQRAEKFKVGGSSASQALKQQICQHPDVIQNSSNPDILKIKKNCD